ncbi:MAG: hypothetical protein Q7R95_01330 [bacterium]|nr:hypothetical protein [bacterium]
MDPVQNVTSPVQKPKTNPLVILKLIIFIIIFISIPVITIILGNMTRKQIKADVSCKSPAIPDPQDCVGGVWKLSKDENGCIHFVCTPQ